MVEGVCFRHVWYVQKCLKWCVCGAGVFLLCCAVLCYAIYAMLSVLCYSLRWVAIVSYLAHESRQLGDEARGRVVRIEEGLAARHHHLGTTPERGREGESKYKRLECAIGSRRSKGLRMFMKR